jgi:alkanesulfonate monooxygenase
MTIEFIWQLPTSGDSRYGNADKQRRGERPTADHPYSPGVTDPRGVHFNYLDHLHQVARAADLAGFEGIRIPEDAQGDEPWILAGYISRGTRHLKLLTEFEASRGSAVYAAKNAVSFQRFTGGRFAWQIKTGGNAEQRRSQGDFAAEQDLHPRIEEFVTISRGVLTQAPFSFKGRFFEVLDGGFQGALGNQAVPPVYLSGHTEADLALSAKVADVHVFDATTVETLRTQISALKSKADAAKRKVAIGLRLDVIARETEKEAFRDATRYRSQSAQADAGSPISTHLWSDLTTAATGANATLIGSYGQIAEALIAYADAGVTSFLLSATPHFEEAYRIGEQVLPLVRERLQPQHRRVA